MNYIREINAFYDWLETNRLSLSAIALWHGLLHINNKAAWADEFAVAISVLCVKTGLSPRGVTEARNELKIKGRIEWRQRKGNQSAVYRILPLSAELQANIADNNTDNCADSYADNHADNGAILNKLNEIKLNDNNYLFDDLAESERLILQTFKSVPDYPFNYEKDLEFIRALFVDFPSLDILEQVKAWSTWLIGKPLKKNSNPRSQIRNWCKNAIKWDGNKSKVVNINGKSNGSRAYQG